MEGREDRKRHGVTFSPVGKSVIGGTPFYAAAMIGQLRMFTRPTGPVMGTSHCVYIKREGISHTKCKLSSLNIFLKSVLFFLLTELGPEDIAARSFVRHGVSEVRYFFPVGLIFK